MRSVASSTTDPHPPFENADSIRLWLDQKVKLYNHRSFIETDPVSVPHQFSKIQDIEIAGFFTAIMSWGQRKTIINKANELMGLMDGTPFDFLMHHVEKDRKRFTSFKHRTLQPDDILYLVDVLQRYYQHHSSLETAFSDHLTADDEDVYPALAGFYEMIFDQELVLERTRKHIATPVRKSSCKRLNMFLRWMVRVDDHGVDFGIWKRISPAQLIIPLDVHVGNVARHTQLLVRPVNDWQAAKELTMMLKNFDTADPVKYDYALFGTGINP